MSDSFSNARLDALLLRHQPNPPGRETEFLPLVSIPAIMFAILGMLFAINFGISLIAIAAAILYYYRFGYPIAAGMAAVLLVMLAVWMMVMPAHHLVAASFGIFLAAIAAQIFGGVHAAGGRSSRIWVPRQILSAPVYAMVMFRERLIKNPGT